MTPEQFIEKHILHEVDCSEQLKNQIVGNALLRYRQHQFQNIEQLILSSRKELFKLMKKQGK